MEQHHQQTSMPEMRPWSNQYREQREVRERLMVNSIKSVTLEQIQLFRNATMDWRKNKRSGNDSLYESDTFETSTNWPNVPFALYSVAENLGSSLTLTPVHRQIVADDRLDLLVVRLNSHANDEINRGKINFKQFYPGSIVCVTMLQRCENSVSKNISEVTFETIKAKPFWEVSWFYPIEQQIVYDVITVVCEYEKTSGGYMNCVASGFNQMLRFKPNQDTRNLEKGSIIATTVSKPWIEPNCDIKGFEKGFRGCFSSSIKKLLSEFKIHPSIINVGEASEVGLKVFRRYKTAFSRYQDGVAYLNIETALSLGEIGVQTVQNHKIDRKSYLTSVDQYTVHYSWVDIKFQLLLNSTNASLKKWDRKVRINVRFGTQFAEGEVTHAIKTRPTMIVSARIIGKAAEKLWTELMHGRKQIEVQQIEDFIPMKISNWNKNMKPGSNGHALVNAYYGGEPIEQYRIPSSMCSNVAWSWMIEYQKEYIHRLENRRTSVFVATSCVGCGMTTAMAAAALHLSRLAHGINIVLVPSDHEAAWFLREVRYLERKEEKAKTIRLISEKHRDEMDCENRTDRDFPIVLSTFFQNFIHGYDGEREFDSKNLKHDVRKMMQYFKENEQMSANDFSTRKMKNLFESSDRFEEEDEECKNREYVNLYLKYNEVTIIVATSETVLEAFTSVWKDTSRFVSTVQIDKAPTLSQSTICQLAVLFQDARFSLIGDLQDHPSHFDEEVPTVLQEAATGVSMERLMENFPVVNFDFVFRCDKLVTKLLGNMFYNDQFFIHPVGFRRDWDLRKSGIIPSGGHQVAVINNQSDHDKHENSFINQKELHITSDLVKRLLGFVKPCKIGVICFFESQRLELLDWAHRTGVTLLMVDSAQGKEFEYVIVLTTRTKQIGNCKVLNNKNRIKTVLSRSKKTVFVLGKISELQKEKHWSQVIKFCIKEEAVCYYPKIVLNQHKNNHEEEIDFQWNQSNEPMENTQSTPSNMSHRYEYLDVDGLRFQRKLEMSRMMMTKIDKHTYHTFFLRSNFYYSLDLDSSSVQYPSLIFHFSSSHQSIPFIIQFLLQVLYHLTIYIIIILLPLTYSAFFQIKL